MSLGRQKISVLCVDDEEIILKSLRRQLRLVSPNIRCEFAQSSEVALNLMERRNSTQSPFVLMIVDHLMPGMKGDELLKKSTLLSPNTYQIMLTGQIDGATVGQVVNHARLFRFLSKPWSFEELNVAVHSALDSYQRDNELREQQITNKRLAHQLRQSQKMEILENLSSEIAHDFNNLLNVVSLGTDALKDDLEHIQDQEEVSNLNPLIKDSLSTLNDISFACHHASKLAKQLLSLSRDSENIEEEFDVIECTRKTITLLQRLMPQDVCLLFTPHPTSLIALGNETALQQVIMNLVINAKDALQSSGTIEVSLFRDQRDEDQHYLVGSIEAGQCICLSVKDNGVGIDDSLVHQIFEPFVSSKGKDGTGLGLSIVYNTVVTSLKGAINVETRGETRFDIYIPLVETHSS